MRAFTVKYDRKSDSERPKPFVGQKVEWIKWKGEVTEIKELPPHINSRGHFEQYELTVTNLEDLIKEVDWFSITQKNKDHIYVGPEGKL